MQDIRYILIFLAGFVAAACQPQNQVEDRLVTAFGETMFGQHGPADDQADSKLNEGVLVKWRTPVRASIVEGATDENTALVREKLDRIAAISGLEVELLAPGNNDAPLAIFFSDKKNFVINGNQLASCFARTAGDDSGFINEAEIHIALVGEGAWQTDCLVHELLHAFGWRGHTHSIRSAVSYMHGESELTRWDEYLMRALYDPRLKSGISKSDALPAARNILQNLLMAQ